MFEVTVPVGNVFADGAAPEDLKDGDFERLRISRTDMDKRILRRRTDRGTDIGLRLDPGTRLRNGDILRVGKDTVVVVEQLPERVVTVRLKDSIPAEAMILLGHIIGNRHRPISVRNGAVVFPIQADSEKAVFESLLCDVIEHIELAVEDKVFFPHRSADVHGH